MEPAFLQLVDWPGATDPAKAEAAKQKIETDTIQTSASFFMSMIPLTLVKKRSTRNKTEQLYPQDVLVSTSSQFIDILNFSFGN